MKATAKKLKRSKWPVLNVTDEERALITQYAKDTDSSVSSYIIQRSLQKPVSPRADYKRYALQQARIINLLEEIARGINTKSPDNAAIALLLLKRLERHQFIYASELDVENEDFEETQPESDGVVE
jgi:hypothetical protein